MKKKLLLGALAPLTVAPLALAAGCVDNSGVSSSYDVLKIDRENALVWEDFFQSNDVDDSLLIDENIHGNNFKEVTVELEEWNRIISNTFNQLDLADDNYLLSTYNLTASWEDMSNDNRYTFAMDVLEDQFDLVAGKSISKDWMGTYAFVVESLNGDTTFKGRDILAYANPEMIASAVTTAGTSIEADFYMLMENLDFDVIESVFDNIFDESEEDISNIVNKLP